MRRFVLASLAMLAFAATPVFADPGVEARWFDGWLRVTLDGSYGGAFYQVWRSDGAATDLRPMLSQYTLCTGDCFLTDPDAVPGRTYWYRFDLQVPGGGSAVSYGPYAVTVPDTPVGLRVGPNPSRGTVRVDLSLPGTNRTDAPLAVDARVLDLQGRTVRVLHAGGLRRGVTSLTWDGRDAAGAALPAGLYFVRYVTPVGRATARITRVQ